MPTNVDIVHNFDLTELYKAYCNCVIHVVDLVGNLEMLQPSCPVVVDVWIEELKSAIAKHQIE